MVSLRLPDHLADGPLRRRAILIQQQTGQPVQFEITKQARRSLADRLQVRRGEPDGSLFLTRHRFFEVFAAWFLARLAAPSLMH